MDWDTNSERKDDMTPEQEGLMAELFMAQFPDKYHNSRIDKARSLYRLAKLARVGRILELGTYHGCGAIALAWGAAAGKRNLVVQTCDDFKEKKGWIGEPYGPEDMKIFLGNVARAEVKVELFNCTEEELYPKWEQWKHPIALLFWDIGGDRLLSDFIKWHSFIAPGGAFAIHDTADCKFGFQQVRAIALATGTWTFERQMPGYVYVLRRGK